MPTPSFRFSEGYDEQAVQFFIPEMLDGVRQVLGQNADEVKQFEIIAALTEGTGTRATARITGVNRETVGTLALRVASVDLGQHPRLFSELEDE